MQCRNSKSVCNKIQRSVRIYISGQLTWAGADKYTKMKAFPTGVTLTNASGAFGKIISEYVIGNIIALYRELPNYWKNKQKHLWVQNRSSETIYGKNILILGTGDIGRNIAHRMKAFETHVTGIKRTAVPEHLQQMKEFDEVYDLTALDQQLQKADILIGCLPGTPETKGLLNYERLYSMKKDAILVNVGRGSLIPTEDLIRVLEEGHLKGAVLDVFETEPLPETSPLWNMENVLITPHIPGYDLEHLYGKYGTISEWKKFKKYCPVKGWVLNKKDSYKLLLINCEAVIRL